MRQGRRRGVCLVLGATLVLAPTLAGTTAASSSTARAPSTERPHLEQWWYDAMGLPEAHRTTTGKGVVVAVLDGYLDPSVPDLKGADIEMRSDCDNDPIPVIKDERADHGTAMVTTIVGQGTGNGPGGRGVRGVAPDATVRFYSLDTNPDRDLIECDAITGGPLIVKAARQGADIISISVGQFSTIAGKYVQKAISLGAVVVAASGEKKNDSTIEYPAATPGAVAVNAGDRQGKSWSLNPRPLSLDAELREFLIKQGEGFEIGTGAYPTITAPGVDTQLGGFTGPRTWTSGAQRTGTSGATAITAGSFALLKSRWPEATANQLIQAVIHHPSGNKDGNLSFRPKYGYGTLAILGALAVDPTKYPDVNPLMQGPKRAIKDFPASVYDASPAPKPSSAAETDDGASADSDDEARATTETAGAKDDGVPAWALGIAAVLAAAGVTVLAALRRRARRTNKNPSTTTNERVPVGHTGDRRPEEQ